MHTFKPRYASRLFQRVALFTKHYHIIHPFTFNLFHFKPQIFVNQTFTFSKSIQTKNLRKLAPFRTGERPQFKKHEMKEFSDVLKPVFLEGLKSMNITTPSEIQRMVIPEILKRKDVLCAAQTGTGKTLAYLLPILQNMKKDEKEGIERREKRPIVLIFVPTKELASQIISVVKQLSHFVKFSSCVLRSDRKLQSLRRNLKNKVDVVVTTPGIFSRLHEEDAVYFTDVRYVVFDEADTLFGKGFESTKEKILIPCLDRRRAQKVQFVFTLATLTNPIQQILNTHFQNINKVFTPQVHKPAKNIEQSFIELKGRDKLEELQKILNEHSTLRTIIFCNTVKSCQAVDYALREVGLNVSSLYSEMPAPLKKEEFEKFKKNETNILITSDIASRGLDLNVDHIIIFDFPDNAIDYLHRIGRTGRMGKPGKVTSLLQKKDMVLANAIQDAIKYNRSLEGLTNDKHVNEQVMQMYRRGRRKRVVPRRNEQKRIGKN